MAKFLISISIILGSFSYVYSCGATGAGVGAGAAGLAVNPAGHIAHGVGVALVPIPGKCIYDEARVRMADGSQKFVKHLNIGDDVLAYDIEKGVHASKIQSQLHSDNETTVTIVEIETSSGRKIPVTFQHSLFARECLSDGREWTPKAAQDVRVGDCVPRYDLADGDVIEEAVVNIRNFNSKGIRQPVTETGTIIVDDVVISCYDRVVHQRATHLALLPYRWMMSIGKTYGVQFKEVIPSILNLLGYDMSLF